MGDLAAAMRAHHERDVRERAAITAMAALIHVGGYSHDLGDKVHLAKIAVAYADALAIALTKAKP